MRFMALPNEYSELWSWMSTHLGCGKRDIWRCFSSKFCITRSYESGGCHLSHSPTYPKLKKTNTVFVQGSKNWSTSQFSRQLRQIVQLATYWHHIKKRNSLCLFQCQGVDIGYELGIGHLATMTFWFITRDAHQDTHDRKMKSSCLSRFNALCLNKKETGTNMPISLKLNKHLNNIGHCLLEDYFFFPTVPRNAGLITSVEHEYINNRLTIWLCTTSFKFSIICYSRFAASTLWCSSQKRVHCDWMISNR